MNEWIAINDTFKIVGLEDGRHEKLVLWFTNNTHIPSKRTIPDSLFSEVKCLIVNYNSKDTFLNDQKQILVKITTLQLG